MFCNLNLDIKLVLVIAAAVASTSFVEIVPSVSGQSIQSEDGDIIECIDIKKQPAFNHPALRSHKIQMRPNHHKSKTTTKREETPTSMLKIVTTQLWRRRGGCPRGTIPVRRMQEKKTTISTIHNKNKSVATFNHQNHHHPISFNRGNMQLKEANKLFIAYPNHSLGVLHAEGYRYMGAKGDIKVWNPKVESDYEYSTSHIALINGPQENYEKIQSGWAVNPKVYGDRQTRLFTYWTVDSSKKTGCFDLTCPGFIQINNEIALGAAIHPISNHNGLPYDITIFIRKDPNTSNWWLQYGERFNIGYWPAELFSSMRSQADMVQWGGDVYSPKVGEAHPHTSTAMGSGDFPDFIFGSSGVIKRMRILENTMELKMPEFAYAYSDEYDCYDVYYLSDYVEDPEFYYGGPGRNPFCH